MSGAVPSCLQCPQYSHVARVDTINDNPHTHPVSHISYIHCYAAPPRQRYGTLFPYSSNYSLHISLYIA